MKATVRAAAVQFGGDWLDPDANRKRLVERVLELGERGVELAVFPELATSGYCRTGELTAFDPDFARRYHACAETIPGPTTDALAEACAQHGMHVTVGVLERDATVPMLQYNSVALVGPSGLIGSYRKVHLPLSEKHYFRAGDELPVFETELGIVGLSICYDGRFPEHARTLALDGAEIICASWAVQEIPGLVDDTNLHWRSYVRAQENSVYFVSANRSGSEAGIAFIGHSAIAAPSGAVVAASATRDEDVVEAVLAADVLERNRQLLPVFADRRPELYSRLVDR
jgi:predicted amidohydrolase